MTRSDTPPGPMDELPSFLGDDLQRRSHPTARDHEEDVLAERLRPEEIHESSDGGAAPPAPQRPSKPATRASASALLAIGVVVAITSPLHGLLSDTAGWTSSTFAAQLLAPAVGAVLIALGCALRSCGTAIERAEQRHALRLERDEELRASLDDLLAHAYADADQLDQVLHALQLQDQKLTNLNNATKMYGKPLVEIAAQTAQMSDTVSTVHRHVASRRPDGADVSQALSDIAATAAETRRQLAELTERVDRAIQRAQDEPSAEIEASIRDVQRELAGLSSAIAQPRAAAHAPAAPPEGVTSPAKPTAPTAPAGDAAGYSAGARKSSSADVLGAIAKLKQMKR
jgi:hypothetical protein